jgi:hypothetical protein
MPTYDAQEGAGHGIAEILDNLCTQLVALRGARPLAGDPCVPRLGDRERRQLVWRKLDRPAALRSPVRQRHLPRRDIDHLVSCARVHGQAILPTPA